MLEIDHISLIPSTENIYVYVFCYPIIGEISLIYSDKNKEEFNKLFPLQEFLVGRFQKKQ